MQRVAECNSSDAGLVSGLTSKLVFTDRKGGPMRRSNFHRRVRARPRTLDALYGS